MTSTIVALTLAAVFIVLGVAYKRWIERQGGERLEQSRRNGAILGLTLSAVGIAGILLALALSLSLQRGMASYLLIVPLAVLTIGLIGSWRRYKRLR